MATNIGPKIGIDGEKQYRDEINNIIQQSKKLASEMKALAESFDDEKKSIEQNTEQRELLNKQIDVQKEKVEKLSEMLEKSRIKYGENSDKTLKWQQAVNNARADLNKLNKELENLPTNLEVLGQRFEQIGDKISSVGDKMSSAGGKLTRTFSVPIAGAFTASVKEAVDWESEFTGVMKTVDETATTTYDDLRGAVMEIATTTASSKTQIAEVMEASGQLGVSADYVEEFTRTMIMLGDTTNLSADNAATSLARFVNITGSSLDNVGRLGSAIVDLGNNFATTESEIMEMATRLASAGTIAGLSETEILALSTAMSSVGINTEAGGTAMAQTLAQISKVTELAGTAADEDGIWADNLERLAEVTGMTGAEFKEAWGTDTVGTLQTFISHLSDAEANGRSTIVVLDELGMSGIRQSNMLQALSLASEMLGNAVDTASNAYEENTALTNEAEKRYRTMETQISQTKEALSNLAISFGQELLPYVQKGMEFAQNLIDKFSGLSQEEKDQIIKIAAIVAAIGPALTIGGKLVSGTGSIISVGGKLLPMIGKIGPAITSVIPAIGSLIAAASPVLIIGGAIIAGLVALGIALYKNWDAIKEKAGELKDKAIEKWGQLKEGIAEKWNQIKEKTSEDLSRIQNAYEEHGGGIKGIFAGAMEAIKIKNEDTFNALNNLTNGKLGEIQESFRTKFDGIKTHVGDKLSQMKENASNYLDSIRKKFEQNGGGIKGVTKTLWDDLTNNYTIGFGALDKLTGGKHTDISEWFGNIFGNLAKNAFNWGSDIIENITDGIKDKAEKVKNAISDIGGTIREYIHFSEPDKGPLSDFNSWMPDMMNQMADQIEAGRARVQTAINHVAYDLAAPQGSVNTLNYGGTTINVYANDNIDVWELAEQVQGMIDADINQKKGVFA